MTQKSARPSALADELAAAVESDLVAHVSLLYGPPFGDVHRDDDAVWFITGERSRHHNGILKATLGRNDPHADIPRLLGPFRGVPMMWWFFPPTDGIDSEIGRALETHGLSLESDRPGMGMQVSDARPASRLDDATVLRVSDPEVFGRWAAVVGHAFGSTDYPEEMSARAFLERGLGDDGPFRHYICEIGGRDVGAVTLSLGAGVAGIANLATVPEQRGRGVATLLAAHALDEARAIGVRLAALSADEAGVGVYERLGFRTVCRHLTYVTPVE